jgi:hypothetical protein
VVWFEKNIVEKANNFFSSIFLVNEKKKLEEKFNTKIHTESVKPKKIITWFFWFSQKDFLSWDNRAYGLSGACKAV